MPETALVPDVRVTVNGRPLPAGAQRDLASVTVLDDVDALSMFTLGLHNWDAERLAVSWSDDDLFAIGSEVTVRAGYLGDLHEVMVGEITGWEPAFGTGRSPTLTVRGYDYRHRLTRREGPRTFTGIKDSGIAATLAREAGLQARVHDTGSTLEYVVQNGQTDLGFLRRRAQRIGYEVYVRGKVLYFQPPPYDETAALVLRLGTDLSGFTARMQTLAQVDKVVVRGWDPERKEEVVATVAQGPARMGGSASGPQRAGRAFGSATSTDVDVSVTDRDRAGRIARGQYDQRAAAFIQGDAECVGGEPRLRAGTVVDIRGAGRTFSGHYYVTSVSHELSHDLGYQTRFQVRRSDA